MSRIIEPAEMIPQDPDTGRAPEAIWSVTSIERLGYVVATVKIGLVSDSHGNLEPLRVALRTFRAAGADRVFFLGGRYADIDALSGESQGGARKPGGASCDEELLFLRAVEGELALRVARDCAQAEWEWLAGRIIRVASRDCPECDGAPRKMLEMVDGRVCCLIHDKSDLTHEDVANSALLFHGNSAQAAVVSEGARIFVTPGHLRALDPDGWPPSFALVVLEGRGMDFVVYSASGRELRRERVELAPQGKVSVM